MSLHRSLGLSCARKATSKGVTAAVYISATEVTRSQYCEQVALRGSCGQKITVEGEAKAGSRRQHRESAYDDPNISQGLAP